MPSASASIWRHSGLRAKPPVARTSSIRRPAAASTRRTSASCRQTPSSAARTRCSRRCARVRPTYAPRGQRAPVRRPLAEQVRQHQQPAGARRGRWRRARAAPPRACLAEVGRQGVAGPLQHDAAVVDRAADDPAVRGERVAEHLAPAGRRPGASTMTRSAPEVPMEQAADAGAHRAEPEVGQRPVAGADHDGVAAGSPVACAAAASVSAGQDVRGRHQLGQLLAAARRPAAAPPRPRRSAARSSSPVAEATEWSVTSAPHRRSST